MEPARGDEASVRAETPLAARTTAIEGVSIRAFLDVAEGTRMGRTDTEDPATSPRVVWRTPESGSVAAVGASAVCEADGPNRFASIRDRARELFASLESDSDLDLGPSPGPDPDGGHPARPRLFGGFSFFPDSHEGPWAGVPDARFVLPAVQFVSTDDGAWLTVAGDRSTIETRLAEWRERVTTADEPSTRTPPTISHVERTTPRATWYDQVGLALSRIESGALKKVVLAQSLSTTLDDPVQAPETLSRLAESYPDCFVFSFSPGEKKEFFGATPERLVSVRGQEVRTGALAGSVERGASDDEDARLARMLTESEKDDHEHTLVVDAIREQLGPLSRSVTVGDREIKKLATVQHLYTPIGATLAESEHVLSLVEALHPTPAVGGLPPDVASETIREIEAFDRGWYAAPVGWFDAAGDGTFAVAIRSAVADKSTATLFAGNGIVAGSDPAEEWDEVQLKYRPVLDALGL